MAEFAYNHEHDYRYDGRRKVWECPLCGKCLPNEPSICDGKRIVPLFTEEGEQMMLDGIEQMFPLDG